MADRVPEGIWETVKAFSEVARGRESQVQAACRGYLGFEAERFQAMKGAASAFEETETPQPLGLRELPPGASIQDWARHVGERDRYLAACDEYMAEAGRHATEAATTMRLWEKENPEPRKAALDRAIARLVCASCHVVAQSDPEMVEEAGLWRWHPECDLVAGVTWALLVDPDNWPGEERRLSSAMDCVKREWGVADAIARLGERERKQKGKGGRPQKYDDEGSRDALMICADWDRAKEAGVSMVIFCKDWQLAVSQLKAYLRHRRHVRGRK